MGKEIIKKESKAKDLRSILEEKKDRISKAKRVKSLLQKHKKLMGEKQALTDFKEPVLDLHRRNGDIETYEHATAGKFLFTHSNGKERYIELRPSDQGVRDYAGRKIRWYTAHEDRPFAGFEDPIVDGESVMLGYEKTKATDLKYQERIQSLKNKAKMTWVWIILAILGGFALTALLVPDAFWDRMFKTGKYAVESGGTPPTAGLIWFTLKGGFKDKWQSLR